MLNANVANGDDAQASSAQKLTSSEVSRGTKRKFAMVEQDKNFQSFTASTHQKVCPFQVRCALCVVHAGFNPCLLTWACKGAGV